MRMSALLAAAVLVLALAGAAAAKIGPVPTAVTPQGLWVGHPEDGLVRVDPQSGRRLGSSADVAVPMALAAGRGRLWAIDGRGNRIVRLDRDGATVTARVPGGQLSAVALGRRSLWVLAHRGPRASRTVLLRLEPESLRVVGTFHLGRRAVRLATGHGAAWLAFDRVSRRRGAGIVAIDETDGRMIFRRRLRGDSWTMTAGQAGMWVVMSRHRGGVRLLLVDPQTGNVVRSIRGPRSPGDADARSGRLWVSSLCEGSRCDISLAGVRAYDERDGRLVAGPLHPWSACRKRSQQVFLAGVTALSEGAAVVVGDGRGTWRLTRISVDASIGPCRRI